MRPGILLGSLVAALLATPSLGAQQRADSGATNPTPYLLGAQVNVIGQDLRPLHSPYAGENSLRAQGDSKISHAYGVYGGLAITSGLAGYLDVEMIRGKGISRVTGLAGPSNGDVLRQGSVDLGSGPYVARAFVRYTTPLATREMERDTLRRDIDQIPVIVAARRVELTAGKFALSDMFDVNRYANSTRSQFMNWALFNNTAWDFAADTRGYTNGIAAAWITPRWTLRAASVQMPREANGNVFDSDLRRARGDNVELTVTAPRIGTVVRALAYQNHGRMGRYADALTVAARTGARPDIVANDRPGREKHGFGLNVEQPLADDGETGMFARYGRNDGATESFVFTEVDRHASIGAQMSGVHWGRAADRFSIGAVQHGIVDVHRRYLGAGGLGFLLGDGRLTYGPEQIVESYYRVQLGAHTQVSPDVQYVRNPGYNRDRGPATILSLRVNVRY